MVTTTVNLTDRHYNGRNGNPITLIGIHTMEAPESPTTAEAVANYFKTVDASAHWCVDNNSRVRVVNDEDGAWAMPPTNYYSLNVEMAGYAGQSAAQWGDPYSSDTLEIVSLCVAEWCHKYSIPVRHLSDSQIAAREKGIAGHVDVNRVFHASDHTDPGSNFPWTYFLGRVNKYLGVVTQVTPPPASDAKWPAGVVLAFGSQGNAVAALQKAMSGSGLRGVRGIEVDGDFGPQTQTAVRNFEAIEGLGVDRGVAGPQVRSALIRIGRLLPSGQAAE